MKKTCYFFALATAVFAQSSPEPSSQGPFSLQRRMTKEQVLQIIERGALDNLKPTTFAVQQQSLEAFVPQLILGGEWTSTIKLTNRSGRSIPPTDVYFVDSTGNDMMASFRVTLCTANGCALGDTITDSGFNFFLNPGGMIEATFTGGSTPRFGFALIDICSTTGTCSSAGLYAEVTLRNRAPGRPDFESVFPLEQPADLQYMLWDHRGGVSTVLYLVNTNPYAQNNVTLEFRSQGDQIIQTQTVTLRPMETQILTLHSIAPATIGYQGTLVIRGQSNTGFPGVIATGLRINPSNSFTPLRAFVPSR